MNLPVTLFFLHNILATLLLGVKFAGRQDKAFKSFGIALLLDGLAFAAWSYGVLVSPQDLLVSVTIGAVAFLASLVLLVHTASQNAPATTRWLMTLLGVAAAIGIFYVGRYVDPADAYISPEGLFFFNLRPLVQMLYIFALALAAFPAIDLIAAKFRSGYSTLIQYGFIAEVVAGIVLITSSDTQVLYIVGWVIGAVYVALWGTLLFNKSAWAGAN